MKKATTYKGSAIKYIADVIIPQLPDSERLIHFYHSLNEYLENVERLRIIRKSKSYNSRGKEYEINQHRFTVTDNETALWIYMESLNNTGKFSFIKAIEKEEFPIAFALTQVERKEDLVYAQYGKQKRETTFSQHGWKHCHILECSPRGVTIDKLGVDDRMKTLLNPLNHFPFPSPRKFNMPKDYGESLPFIGLVIQEIRKAKNNEPEFLNCLDSFLKEAKGEFNNHYEDFEIQIGEKNGEQIETKDKTDNTMVKNTNNSNITYLNRFQIRQDWVGEGKIIQVNFQRGNYTHLTYVYNHDAVVKVYETYLNGNTSRSWDIYRTYMSGQNIPGWAKNSVDIIKPESGR